jgi:D-alanyl-D-alanine carboxypeptidase
MLTRLFGPFGLKDTLLPPASTSNTIPKPFSHGYLYGSSSIVTTGVADPPYTPEFQAAVARSGPTTTPA